jgi:hypothetical protein
LKVHFTDKPPKFRKAQGDEKDAHTRDKVRTKIGKVLGRRYIAPGLVESLTTCFSVPKGDDDIRIVYDGTGWCGLNEVLYVPRFLLPTVSTHLRQADANTFMADKDVGEMFLNFVLHEELRKYTRVD